MVDENKKEKPTGNEIPPNYRYWQENGGKWVAEYDWRKKFIPYYSIQELVISLYMSQSQPAKVLEFGCGVGRHLSYLSKIKNIEVYGFDQSFTMIQGIRNWATEEWIAKHIELGKPLESLPYPDNHFDIVFTAEVLVHVRPADIESILRELVRVARWQVFHIETSNGYELVEKVHSGCWFHDLPSLYAKLGYQCDVLPAPYRAQRPYRVILDRNRTVYEFPETVMELFKNMETSLTKGWREREDEITKQEYSLNQKLAAHKDVILELAEKLTENDKMQKDFEKKLMNLRQREEMLISLLDNTYSNFQQIQQALLRSSYDDNE